MIAYKNSKAKRVLERSFEVSQAIGRVTFLEILRDKVLYNIVLCSAVLLGVGFLASRLATLTQGRVILDFGLTATSLSCLAVALLSGASMIGRELERRTFSVALSRPITTWQFAIGKLSGLLAVVSLNWLLMIVAFLSVLFFAEGVSIAQRFSGALVWALLLILLESFVLASFALFFSSFSTTSLSIIFSLGMLLIGNNISQLKWLATKDNGPILNAILNSVTFVFPNFEHFNLGTKVTYSLPVRWSFGFGAVFYALVLIVLAVAGSGYFLKKRDS